MNEINICPENFLSGFNTRLNRIYLNALMHQDAGLEDKIKNVLKKTVVTEVFNDRYTIAISGLQGVGKSTLIKTLYELPDNIIPETRSIGEKIPVLITEWDKNEYGFKGKIIKSDNKKSSIEEIVIPDSKTFLEISMNPSMEYIVLELMVPARFFNAPNKSFVLLPGLEQNRDLWNDLAKHVLYSSSNCILVFNEQRLNDANNSKLVEEINKEFRSAKPIIALTFGDQSSDCNAELKNEVINKFGIPSDEHDRVIRTSIKKEELERWRNQFINSVDKYSSIEKEFRVKQINILDNLLKNEVNDILNLVERNNYRLSGSKNLEANEPVINIMKSVNKRQAEIKKYYHKELLKEVNRIAQKAVHEMRDTIRGKSIFSKLKKQLFSQSLKDIEEFNEAIMSCWNKADNGELTSIPSKIVYSTIEDQYPKVYGALGYNIESLADQEVAITSVDCMNKSISRSEKRKLDELMAEKVKLKKVIADIDKLFSKDGNENLSMEVADSKEYIPLLVLQILLITDDDSKYFNNVVVDGSGNENEVNFNSVLSDADKNKHMIINSIAGVLGLDSIDGTGNIVQAIFSTVGIEIGAKATVAISASLSCAILIGSLISKLNKADLQTYGYSQTIIDSISSEVYTQMKENFDSVIDKMFKRIEEQLRTGFRLNDAESRYFICQKNLNDMKAFTLEFRENINEYRCYLG